MPRTLAHCEHLTSDLRNDEKLIGADVLISSGQMLSLHTTQNSPVCLAFMIVNTAAKPEMKIRRVLGKTKVCMLEDGHVVAWHSLISAKHPAGREMVSFEGKWPLHCL